MAGGLLNDGHQAAQLHDHWSSQSKGKQALASKGVYSNSITLLIDDTASLWNFPSFPNFPGTQHEEQEKRPRQDSPESHAESSASSDNAASSAQNGQRKKKIHLVILTHGLHSNLGADMLYLKESIDAAARNKRDCTKERHRRHRDKNDKSKTSLNE